MVGMYYLQKFFYEGLFGNGFRDDWNYGKKDMINYIYGGRV